MYRHFLKGTKQSEEHVEKRIKAMVETRKRRPWKAGREFNSPEVLWSKVDKGGPDDCWPWTGATNCGYGRTWIGGKGYYAHRVIYLLQYPGSISLRGPRRHDAWGFLRHMCNNPICCNPRHLILGTHSDNMQDKVKSGSSKIWTKSVRTPRAKLTSANVRCIRETVRSRRETGGGPTNKELAAMYDVSVPTIKGVMSGRHYADVTD